jgi:dihydrofolate synthase/folylpolyglutamate synthase
VLEGPLACAVASLGLDHVQYLGPTLADVAAEKGGIFKRGVPAVSAGQPAEAADVLQRKATELSVPLWRPGRDYAFESRDVRPFCYQGRRWTVRAGDLALQGHHQRTNAALACALLEVAVHGAEDATGARGGRRLPVEPRHVEQGLQSARWPGRLERIVTPLGDVWLDGAHNPHAAAALARSMPGLARGRPVRLVFGALQDKDVAGMLAALAPLAATVHYCAPDSPRALRPEELIRLRPGRAHASVKDALDAALREGGLVLCAGSLYLVGEVRALLSGAERASMPSERL